MHKKCLIKSPIFLKSTNKNLIPPLVCKNKIYIISDKKLYLLLQALGKFQYYIKAVRLKGYKYTSKWLKENKLYNEAILEEISYYSLNNNFKNLKTYLAFDKKRNLIANINNEYFTNYFEKVILFHFIREYKKEFNLHLKNRLSLIEKELKTIKNTNHFKNRKSYHQKVIFNGILNSFLNKMYFDPTKEFHLLNNLNIKTQSNFLSHNLGVYKIAGLKGYKNCSIKKSNIRYKECLKPNNSFELKFITHSSEKNTSVLLKKSQDFVKYQLDFDKEYICELISKNSTTITIKDSQVSSEIINTIEKSYFTSLFENLEGSNIIIKPIDTVLKSILLLNMDSYNINKLNIILEKPKAIYSEIVELAQESSSNNLEGFGYAVIE